MRINKYLKFYYIGIITGFMFGFVSGGYIASLSSIES